MNNPRHASSVPAASLGSAAPSEPAAGDTELHFVDDYLPALLAQASQLISSEFHEVARQHGFSISEWRVMASLAGGEPISIGQLAQVTVTKQPTVTRLLDRMEARGQVERLPHDSDRRITLVRITRQGAKAVEHLMELAREHELRVLEPFGLARAEELKRILRQLIELHARAPGEVAEEE
jgi:DNA-binding MarR family transcriptional regulator